MNHVCWKEKKRGRKETNKNVAFFSCEVCLEGSAPPNFELCKFSDLRVCALIFFYFYMQFYFLE